MPMEDGRDKERQRALDRAMRALALRAHSEQEIVEKLEKAGYDEQLIAETMAKLAEHRLIDDADFARQWSAARARRGMGRWRIAHELRHKGVQQATIDEALLAIDEDTTMERAVTLARKHLARGDERARRRAYEALVRRGYDYSVARQAIEAAEQEIAEEEAEDESDE